MRSSFVCDTNMCTGCGMCVNICPQKAINIIDNLCYQNAEINKEKCIQCNLCHSRCPQNTPVENKKPIEWHQGWNPDNNERALSSSGGIGYALAKCVINKGGYVISCLLENGIFEFSIAKTIDDLSRFRGSKYVKSNAVNIYESTKKLLEDGKTILFIGLPCQVAGIKRFVGDNLSTNLITTDLICHGSPSSKLLEMFLGQYNISLSDLSTVSFRDKQLFSISLASKKTWPKQIKDKYTLAFLEGMSYTENCYGCAYAKLGRVSDITLGDSWGTDLKSEEAKGVSLVLCQSEKGLSLLNECGIEKHPVNLEIAIKNNKQLERPSRIPDKRETFFKYLHEGMSFNKAVFLTMPKESIKQDIKRILLPILFKRAEN